MEDQYVEQREFERTPLMIEATTLIDGETRACILMNISAGGAKIQLTAMSPELSIDEGSGYFAANPQV